MRPVVIDSTGTPSSVVGEIWNIVLFLEDLDDGLPLLVQGDTNPGNSRLVEHLLGVLLLGRDRLVETGRGSTGWPLARGRSDERAGDERGQPENGLGPPDHPGLSFETHPLGARTLVPSRHDLPG